MSDCDRLWEDADNWRLGAIYVCKDDPRIVVPKRLKWTGWTFNFAHRASYLLLVFVLFTAIVPCTYTILINRYDLFFKVLGICTIFVFAVVWACARVGRSPKRI